MPRPSSASVSSPSSAHAPLPPLSVRHGQLGIQGLPLTDLAQRFGVLESMSKKSAAAGRGPLYVYDAERIRENFRRLKAAFSDPKKRWATRIYYAVKANPNPHLIRLLAKAGAGADCCNIHEIALARQAGVADGRILYSGNNNPAREITQALDEGLSVNFDDAPLFERHIGRLNPSKTVLSFRFNPGRGLGENSKITTAGADSKFGMAEGDVMRAYGRAQELGVRRFGLHMMTGSNTRDVAPFVQQVRAQLRLAGRLQREWGIHLEFIDIGGGFGVPYRPGQKPLDIRALGSRIRAEFERGLRAYSLASPSGRIPDLMMEPGRYLVADAGVLLAEVTHVKRSFGRRLIGLEASMATLLRPALYDSYHHIQFEKRGKGRAGVGPGPLAHRPSPPRPRPPSSPADVVGMACENSDYFARDRTLPDDLEPGDLAIFSTAGAYGFSMSSNYCDLPRPAEVLVERGGKPILIRSREGTADLARRTSAGRRLAPDANSHNSTN